MNKVLSKCEKCGIDFLVVPYELKRGKGRFCSRSCRSKVTYPEALSKLKGTRKPYYEANKIQRKKYPEKYRAVWAVKLAIKNGKLIRKPCEICNNEKSQAHHEDYSKPLEVRFLCEIHHKQRHKELKAKSYMSLDRTDEIN